MIINLQDEFEKLSSECSSIAGGRSEGEDFLTRLMRAALGSAQHMIEAASSDADEVSRHQACVFAALCLRHCEVYLREYRNLSAIDPDEHPDRVTINKLATIAIWKTDERDVERFRRASFELGK